MAVKADYNCKQHELYSVAMAALHSFTENQARFAGFKSKYASPYEVDFQALIDAAISLPAFQMRDMKTEVAGIKLKEEAEKCLDNWQSLKRYIRDVKDWENLQKPKIEGAGSMLYGQASAYNWEYVKQLNVEGLAFMNEYSAELQADGNMPATFISSYETAKIDYETQYNELLDKKQDNPVDTENKVIANNALYKELMRMFDDGLHIFKKEDALNDRFTFTKVLNKIRKPTSGGGGGGGGGEPTGDGAVKGKVTSSAGGNALAGALVTYAANDGEQTFTTDINGLYDSGTIKNGAYAVKVWDENHEQLETTVTVNGDTTQDFVMVPLV